jgi:hypothetical protein
MCELIHNSKVKYRAACGSTKRYSNRLSPGKYLFLVWGVNKAGSDPHPMEKKFTL